MIHDRTLTSLEYGKITQYLADLCISAPGRKRMLNLKPYLTVEEANYNSQLYEENRVFSETQSENHFKLLSFPDVSGLFNLATEANVANTGSIILDLDAFWALRETLTQAQLAFQAYSQRIGQGNWPQLYKIVAGLSFPETLFTALKRCIGDDGSLKDDASPELARIRQELRTLHQNCLKKVKDFAQKYNIQHYLQDEYMTISSDRYVLPLKANFKGRLQGIIHDWSQTGETCYFEPIFLVEVNNRLAALKREERQEERKILTYLSSLFHSSLRETKDAYEFLGLLDFLNAKQLMALYLNCETISFGTPEEGIDLHSARHPLLAILAQGNSLGKNENDPKPLEIKLNPGQHALIITGGNAGGKTVCLKTMGLVAAMAMSGLPVTVARGSHIPWFNRLDAFIGDEQSIDDQVSTFTAQIEHLAKAWKHLDNNALVLLDEFGAGTDPAEGAALAQSVLDGLLEKHCFAICATHFPALKSYALTHEHVAAASMLFNPATHKPLYKLAYGQVGSSQALEVAKEYGLPESIIARARHYLLLDGEDSGAILKTLNNLAAEREKEIANLRQEQTRSAAILSEKREALKKERERLQTEIKNKISELMSEWKKEKISAKQALKNMGSLRDELGLPSKETSVLPKPETFAGGMRIFHNGFNRSGLIVEMDERRRKARIDMNGVSLWANFDDLRVAPETGQSHPATSPIGDASKASLSLDIRGMRSDEALLKLESFLDKALLAGYPEVEIIHGRGTGTLRKQVHNFLQSFHIVAHFSLAPEDRGGDGMTLVSLR